MLGFYYIPFVIIKLKPHLRLCLLKSLTDSPLYLYYSSNSSSYVSTTICVVHINHEEIHGNDLDNDFRHFKGKNEQKAFCLYKI